jgi:hypothetical protein
LQKTPQHESPRLRPVKEFLGKYRRDVDASAKEVGYMINLPTGEPVSISRTAITSRTARRWLIKLGFTWKDIEMRALSSIASSTPLYRLPLLRGGLLKIKF